MHLDGMSSDLGFFELPMPRQKIVDALTGVISNQAVLPNRFCVSWLCIHPVSFVVRSVCVGVVLLMEDIHQLNLNNLNI